MGVEGSGSQGAKGEDVYRESALLTAPAAKFSAFSHLALTAPKSLPVKVKTLL